MTAVFQDQDGGLAGSIPTPRWYLLSGGSPVLGDGELQGRHPSVQASYGSGDSFIPAVTELNLGMSHPVSLWGVVGHLGSPIYVFPWKQYQVSRKSLLCVGSGDTLPEALVMFSVRTLCPFQKPPTNEVQLFFLARCDPSHSITYLFSITLNTAALSPSLVMNTSP